MRTLTITDEKVKEAAGKCPTAKIVLETLFPEAFNLSEIDLLELTNGDYEVFPYHLRTLAKVGHFIQIRKAGPHAGKAFWLDPAYKWAICKDSTTLSSGELLIPTRK